MAFQFHKVRLKEFPSIVPFLSSTFQFHKVRLKEVQAAVDIYHEIGFNSIRYD